MTASPTPVEQRPISDVSAGVGIAGLCGLFAWLLICRQWPFLSEAFNLSGPRARMDGPYAALTAVLCSGLPMVLWSLCLDKVHRRPTTGIDWSQRRPVQEILPISVTKLAGLWVTWAIIAGLYCIARWYWRGPYLFAMDVLGFAAIPMFVLSVPYVIWLDRRLIEPRDGAWHFGAMLLGRESYSLEAVYAHLRSWAVKGFFCAFMISILPAGFKQIINLDVGHSLGHPVYFSAMLTNLLFLIDVQIAMVGYLLTMKPLDAHIRSANPFLAGWVAALICYPPFILMGSGGVLDYHPHTEDWAYWLEQYPAVQWGWGLWLVFLTGIYAWATVAFGLRFSNLTYRGIVTNGPYRFTRHPAYLAKNTFWWCSTLPFLVTSQSTVDAIRNTVILAMVSGVYFWRAKTEERHLLSEDAKYRDYHRWMADNAAITRGLGRMGKQLRPRGPQLPPAS